MAQRTTSLIAGTTLMVLAVAPAASQERIPETILRNASANRWHVRVSAVPSDSINEGRLYRTGGKVTVGRGVYEPSDITRLERRTERGYGAVVGGVVGAVLAGVVGTGVSRLQDGSDANDKVMVIVGFSSIGAWIGTMAGNAIRPSTRSWETVWPDPNR